MRSPGALPKSLPQSQRAVLQLKGRISELEAELAEQKHLRQQAADDSEFLRAELDELKKKREDTEKAQRSLTEIESEKLVGVGVRGWVREIRMEEGAGWQSPTLLCICPEELSGRPALAGESSRWSACVRHC